MPQAVSSTFRNLKLPARRGWIRLWDLIFLAWGLMAVVRLFRAGEANDEDFRVYYRAARAFADGANPYAFSADDRGFVFKYFPWFLPFFYPLHWLSWDQARATWYVVQLAGLVYGVAWIFRQLRGEVSWRLPAAAAAAYWWLWHSHFSAGQVAALILAACAWSQRCPTPLRLSALNFFLTSKIFSAFTALGRWRAELRWQTLAATAATLVLAHLAIAALSPVPLEDLYRAWWQAALSGGAELQEEAIRGQGNNGLTVFFMRVFGVPARASHVDVVAALGLGAALALVWSRASRGLRDFERWAGWMALGVIIHPLAWHHSYVVVQPLSTFALARAYRSGSRALLGLAVLGLACVALFVPQVIGTTLARPAELGSLKAWGALLSAAVLVVSARRGSRATAPATAPGGAPRV